MISNFKLVTTRKLGEQMSIDIKEREYTLNIHRAILYGH